MHTLVLRARTLIVQKTRMKAAGCEVIPSETISGASRSERTEMAIAVESLRKGVELVFHRLDWFGRSIRDMLNRAHELEAKGASLGD